MNQPRHRHPGSSIEKGRGFIVFKLQLSQDSNCPETGGVKDRIMSKVLSPKNIKVLQAGVYSLMPSTCNILHSLFILTSGLGCSDVMRLTSVALIGHSRFIAVEGTD